VNAEIVIAIAPAAVYLLPTEYKIEFFLPFNRSAIASEVLV